MSIYKQHKNKFKTKLAKYFNYIEQGENILFIYLNPTGSEIDNMLSESKYGVIRAFLHSDGSVYAWDGDYLHDFVSNKFPEIQSAVHLEIKKNELSVFITSEVSSAKILKNYISKINLSNFKLDGNSYLAIDTDYYGAPVDDIYIKLWNEYDSTINMFFDLVDGKNIQKVSRLKLKVAKIIYLKDILSEDDINSYGYNTDYGNRSFAISYINGQLFEGNVHKDTIEEYLENNNLDPKELLNYSEGFVTEDEQEDIDIPTAFASYINGIDGNHYIAIYPDSLYNVGLDDVENSLKQKYPNAIICLDNNDRYAASEEETENYIETI